MIYLVTPAFCKAPLLAQCLDHLYADPTTTGLTTRHIIIDNHYPVEKERNSAVIKELAAKFNCRYVDSGKDLGLHHGLNNAIKQVNVNKDDLLIGCDPDDRPRPGAMKALVDVMNYNPKIAIAALTFNILHRNFGDLMARASVNKPPVPRHWAHPSTDMWKIAAFRMSFVEQCNGFQEPNKYYGGIESNFHQHWKRLNMQLVYLPDHQLDHVGEENSPEFLDTEYWQYKQAHVRGQFTESFEEWIKAHCPWRLTGERR
jgi:hypothetical protein